MKKKLHHFKFDLFSVKTKVRTVLALIVLFGINQKLFAQPAVMSINQDVSGTYANTTTTLKGGVFQARFQEDATGTSAGTRNWQFNSDSYTNVWGTVTSTKILAGYDTTIVPSTATASGNWALAGSNAFGKLPATIGNYYYTYNIVKGTSYTSQNMAVLETSYNPVTITAVANATGAFGNQTVTITTSAAPNATENIFVRYSTNGYASSTLVQATGSGTTWTATIPWQSSAVSYNVYTSNKSLGAINADVTTNGQTAHDTSMLNLNNNSGANYTYAVANAVYVTSTTGSSTTASYATLAAAVTAINGGAVHSGAIVCYINAGYTETAPAGGYSITASGTSGAPITFIKNGVGANPVFTASTSNTIGSINDAIFKIIGGDYITIDGFTLQESTNSTTGGVAPSNATTGNNMTEFGVVLFYGFATNNCQNITLKNNTIDLDRRYQNTFGIYANSTHTSTNMTASTTATGNAGGTNNLTITTNNITDVNIGIVVVGPTAFADFNDNVVIGGAGLGNTITNYGTTNIFSGYVNVAGSVNGILLRNTLTATVSNNTVTSSVGGVTAGTLNGIQIPAASNTPSGLTFTVNINSNNISLKSGLIAGAMNGIILPSGSASTTSILNVNNNDFNNFGHTVAGTGAITFISNASTHLTTTISNNTFTNLNVNTTGNVTFISNNVTVPAGGIKNLNSNSIVTAFNKTGAGGTVNLYTDNASSTSGTTFNNSNLLCN